MRFEDYSKNGIKIAFNCPTNDMANLVFSIFRYLGYKRYFSGTIHRTLWSIEKENTWYYVYPSKSICIDREFNYSCCSVNIFEIENVAEAIAKNIFVF